MTRRLLILLAPWIVTGCIRLEFDLCLEDPPHPECTLDASTDEDGGALDGAPTPMPLRDGGSVQDASAEDATASDAGDASNPATDAGPSADAGG